MSNQVFGILYMGLDHNFGILKFDHKLHPNNSNYPTIDHKISTFYGFNNNIDYKEIAKIENLCFTKRSNNSKKNVHCTLQIKKDCI